jgi:hypothetical protein
MIQQNHARDLMGKGGGGGGGSTKVDIPHLGNLEGDLETTSDWERYFLNEPYSIGNWALNQATGGQVQQAGWNNQAGVVGGGVQIGGAQQFGSGSGGGGGTSGGGSFGTGAAPGTGAPTDWVSLMQQYLSGEAGWRDNQGQMLENFGTTSGQEQNQTVQDWLQGTGSTIDQSLQEATSQYGQAQGWENTFGNEVAALMSGSGLLPNQAAMIDTQTQAAQQGTLQQLANAGLANSSMNQTLTGQEAQAGAAAKGQLVDKNIGLFGGLLEGEQGMAQGAIGQIQQGASLQDQATKTQIAEQGVELAQQGQMFSEESQMYQEMANEFSQASGEQKNLFEETLGGYGLESQFVNNVLSPYGYELQAYKIASDASVSQAQINAGLEEAEMKAQSQQSSSFMSSLGDLFGGSGGSGGKGGGSGGSSGGGTNYGSYIGAALSIAAMFL